MNYTEAIDWLENIPISFDSNYDGYELKLVNIAKFLEQLGNPQNDLSLIHVGGTNGKGSTCHIISSILQEHGFKVGLFSSPHIYDFRERIKINSNYIDKDFILEFIKDNKNYITKNNLSFFETSFAIALCYFKKIKPEYVIIEVGVVAMGLEQIDFMWYLKKIAFLAFIGYIAGFMTFILLRDFVLI